jgi:AcrR family transcriptional regulator
LASGVFEHYTSLFRAVRRLLDGLAEDGLDRTALNARAHLLLSAVNWLRGWLRRHEPDEYPQVARRCLQLLLHGMAATGQVWPAAPGPIGHGPVAPEGANAVMAPDRLAALAANDGVSLGTTEAFLRAATELVNEQGYRGASIDRIAARLQMTKGAFYHHHDNKLDLISACFERSQRIVRQALTAASQLHGDGWQQACAATAALVRFQLSEHGPLLRATAYSALPDPQTRLLVLGRAQRLNERMVGLLVDGMVDGSVRPHDPVGAAQLLACASNAAAELRRWVPGVTMAQSDRVYARPALCGLLAPP